MPTVFSAGAASTQGFGNQFNPPSPFNMMSANQNNQYVNSVQDYAGNIIYITRDDTSATNPLLVTKTDFFGSIIWQKDIGGSPNSFTAFCGLTVDSSNNIYFSAQTSNAATGFNLYKLNSSGTLLLSSYYFGSGLGVLQIVPTSNLRIDSSGNIYVAGFAVTSTSGANYAFVMKISSAFAVTWAVAYTYTSVATQYNQATDLALDSSNNIFVLNSAYDGTKYLTYITKFNTSGTILASTGISNGAADMNAAYSIYVDSTNNVYFTMSFPSVVLKINNALSATTWQTQIYDLYSGSVSSPILTVGSDGVVYVAGSAYGYSFTTSATIITLNSTTGSLTSQSYVQPYLVNWSTVTPSQYSYPTYLNGVISFPYISFLPGVKYNGVIRLPTNLLPITNSQSLNLNNTTYNLNTNASTTTSSLSYAVGSVTTTTQAFSMSASPYTETTAPTYVTISAATFV